MNKILLAFFLCITICLPLFGQAEAVEAHTVVILENKLQAVFGGVESGKFVNANIAVKSLPGLKTFTPYGSDGLSGARFEVGSGERPSIPCEEFYQYASNDNPKNGVSFSSNVSWDPSPRQVTKLKTNSKIYRPIVRKFLKKQGLRNPVVNITALFKVDLEGDGVDEVVILGERYVRFGPGTQKGDYSFLLVRKVINGKVKEILVTGEFYKQAVRFGAPNRLEISSIVDLDGDGTLEIVIYGAYYEGVWAEAYKIKGGTSSKVLTTGCGV